jgi:hypothetical protein
MMSDMESLLKSQGIVFDRSKMSVHIVYSIDKSLSDFWQRPGSDIYLSYLLKSIYGFLFSFFVKSQKSKLFVLLS